MGDGALLKMLLPTTTPQQVTLRVSPQGQSLRTQAKATFKDDLKLNLKPWDIPTNTIREPIIGFTAAQGFVKDRLTGWGPFKNSPAPEQAFLWNDDRMPFSIYAIAKVIDPAAVVKKFAVGIDLKEAGKIVTGSLEFNTNTSTLMLSKGSLPVVVPFIGPATETDNGFLMAGLVPMAPGTKPLPPELAKELTSRTNLVYYDWEITTRRLKQIPVADQVRAMAMRAPFPPFDRPAFKWLDAVDKLGNAVTEVTQTGPRELSLVRASDMGFAAIELYKFVSWIAGPPPATPREGGAPLPK
jgi:hypothetical protein